MLGKKKQSSLLAKYFAMYKKNPRSKVFAPLAEAYRKLGMYEDAFKILKDGIRQNPKYTLGYIVLAHCYYDQEKFELTYNTLRPIVAENADNISLQKIFAQSCLHLGYLEEALDTYKYLLFMNPKEKFFAEQVKKLEDDLFVGHKKLTLDQIVKAPDVPALVSPQTFDDDWVQVDFSERKPVDKVEVKTALSSFEEEWVMKKPGAEIEKPAEEHSFVSRSLDDEYFADEFESEGEAEAESPETTQAAPIISHTLIDLYCAQGYFDKAIELLEKIIELNPQDQASNLKLRQVQEMKGGVDTASKSEKTEEEGHLELIDIIENKVKTKHPLEIKLQQTFDLFLAAVRVRAQEFR